MNKTCKEYIAEIKSFFPIYRKPERVFIKKLTLDIEDFCEESNTSSKNILYDKYGKPHDIVNNYFSSIDTKYIVKQIRISRYIKLFIAVLLVLATIATSSWCVFTYRDHQITARQEIFFEDEVLLETN